MRVVLLVLTLFVVVCVLPAFAQNDEYDVRKVRWGMTKEEVKASEEGPMLGTFDDGSLAYKETLFENEFFIAYKFDTAGKLFEVAYFCKDAKFKHAYEMIKVNLDAKYKDALTPEVRMFTPKNVHFYESDKSRISLSLYEEKNVTVIYEEIWQFKKAQEERDRKRDAAFDKVRKDGAKF